MVEPVTHLRLDTPAGLIAVDAEVRDGKCRKVTFRNVPAFATHLDAPVEVAGLGTVIVDVAYGGMFYVMSAAEPLGLRQLTQQECAGAEVIGRRSASNPNVRLWRGIADGSTIVRPRNSRAARSSA